MKRWSPPLSPEVRALLDREREIPPLPAAVRARALARAQAALLAGGVTAPDKFDRTPRTSWSSTAIAGAVVAAASVAAAAVGAISYQVGAHRQAPAVEQPAAAAGVVTAVPTPHISPPALTPAPVSTPIVTKRPPRPSHLSPRPDELHLLRKARAAVARQDFAAALRPIAEHARQFRHGRLVEEREALRVKSLVGLGRIEEARRGAEAFRTRFPRSVLLPAVNHMVGSGT